MNLSKSSVLLLVKEWLKAWNEHSIDGVMQLLHEDIIFENWTGERIESKDCLRKAWIPWFLKHGNFKFFWEESFFDEEEQKMLFMWRLEWPSTIKAYNGMHEVRRGIDVLHFLDGKIIQKYSYSKTTLQIEGRTISL